MTDEEKVMSLWAPGLAARTTSKAATVKVGGLTGEEFVGDLTGAELVAALEPVLRAELAKLLAQMEAKRASKPAPKTSPAARTTTKGAKPKG